MLAGHQKTYLRGLGHHLDVLVHIGKGGVTPAIEDETRLALAGRELIKVRFLEHKAERKALIRQLAAATGAEVVGEVGHVALIYREQPDAEKRKIRLPHQRNATETDADEAD